MVNAKDIEKYGFELIDNRIFTDDGLYICNNSKTLSLTKLVKKALSISYDCGFDQGKKHTIYRFRDINSSLVELLNCGTPNEKHSKETLKSCLDNDINFLVKPFKYLS